MKNVVQLLTYLDSQTGGMERQALALSTRLRSRGHHIFFITCIHFSDLRSKRLSLIGTLGGFRVYRIPLIGGWRHLNMLLYFFGAATLLLFLRRRYTIIHAHQLYTSGVIAAMVKLLLPNKFALAKNCCGGSFGDLRYLRALPQAERVMTMVRQRIDAFIAISDETEHEMEEEELSPVLKIPNGIDIARFKASDISKELLKRKLHPELCGADWVLFVGKFDPQKNIPTLINAFAQLPRGAYLLIVGAGDMQLQIEELVRSRGVEDRVILCGTTTNIEAYYQAADLFVLPSKAEGSPNVLLEAMASGLPCIGSDISSISEIITDRQNGIIFGNYAKVDALARAMAELLADPEMRARLASAARQTMERDFSAPVITAKYEALYARQKFPS